MSREQITEFDKELYNLCNKYGIFIQEVSDRKNAPQDKVFFREYKLSIKVEEGEVVHLLVE